MKITVLATLVALLASGLIVAYQDEQHQQEPPKINTTKPQWVVILRADVDATDYGVEIFEFRVVVRALTEGEATLRATFQAQNMLHAHNQHKIKFIEAQKK